MVSSALEALLLLGQRHIARFRGRFITNGTGTGETSVAQVVFFGVLIVFLAKTVVFLSKI